MEATGDLDIKYDISGTSDGYESRKRPVDCDLDQSIAKRTHRGECKSNICETFGQLEKYYVEAFCET